MNLIGPSSGETFILISCLFIIEREAYKIDRPSDMRNPFKACSIARSCQETREHNASADAIALRQPLLQRHCSRHKAFAFLCSCHTRRHRFLCKVSSKIEKMEEGINWQIGQNKASNHRLVIVNQLVSSFQYFLLHSNFYSATNENSRSPPTSTEPITPFNCTVTGTIPMIFGKTSQNSICSTDGEKILCTNRLAPRGNKKQAISVEMQLGYCLRKSQCNSTIEYFTWARSSPHKSFFIGKAIVNFLVRDLLVCSMLKPGKEKLSFSHHHLRLSLEHTENIYQQLNDWIMLE